MTVTWAYRQHDYSINMINDYLLDTCHGGGGSALSDLDVFVLFTFDLVGIILI